MLVLKYRIAMDFNVNNCEIKNFSVIYMLFGMHSL